jgi:hypothetical protein
MFIDILMVSVRPLNRNTNDDANDDDDDDVETKTLTDSEFRYLLTINETQRFDDISLLIHKKTLDYYNNNTNGINNTKNILISNSKHDETSTKICTIL